MNNERCKVGEGNDHRCMIFLGNLSWSSLIRLYQIVCIVKLFIEHVVAGLLWTMGKIAPYLLFINATSLGSEQ